MPPDKLKQKESKSVVKRQLAFFIVSKISFLIPIALKNSCVKTTGEPNVKNTRDKNIVILFNDYTYIVLGVRRERGRLTKRESENK